MYYMCGTMTVSATPTYEEQDHVIDSDREYFYTAEKELA